MTKKGEDSKIREKSPVEWSFPNNSFETKEEKVSAFVTLSYSLGLLQYKSEAAGAGKKWAITAITIDTF